MDARNAPPEPLNPPPTGPEPREGSGHRPLLYIDTMPGPAAGTGGRDGDAGAQPAVRLPVGQSLERLAEQSAMYATRAFGPGTKRADRSAWAKYTT